jgi:hypothetical protein
MDSSRTYLCEFRGRCPPFDKRSKICLETPWVCTNWKMHIEGVRRGVKPVLKASDLKLTNFVGKPEQRNDPLYEDTAIRQQREAWIYDIEKKKNTESREINQEMKMEGSPSASKIKSSPYFKGQLAKKAAPKPMPTHLQVNHPDFDNIRESFEKQPFENIWNNIISSQDVVFYSEAGKPFTYWLKDDVLIYTSRSKHPIHKEVVEKCYSVIPVKTSHSFNTVKDRRRGSTYIWGLLHDVRILLQKKDALKFSLL